MRYGVIIHHHMKIIIRQIQHMPIGQKDGRWAIIQKK
jgi:hypothetical protein